MGGDGNGDGADAGGTSRGTRGDGGGDDAGGYDAGDDDTRRGDADGDDGNNGADPGRTSRGLRGERMRYAARWPPGPQTGRRVDRGDKKHRSITPAQQSSK